jgi:elongation factor Ts
MTAITAAMVKELRDATSAAMMDCKRALQESEGDFDTAVRLLREKGMAQAAKRAGRETSEGVVLTEADDTRGTIVAVGCETEPVSKNDDFQAFANDVLEAVHEGGEEAAAKLDERRAELTARLGENIQIVGAKQLVASNGESFDTYVHKPANKIGVLVEYTGDAHLARLLALHISWSKPTYRSREEVPAELVEAERQILAGTDEVQSKPENVREKIVEGMLNKRFYGESVLGEQTWIHDTSLTVSKALAQGGFELVDYAWYSVG